jgi:hypothetical protein
MPRMRLYSESSFIMQINKSKRSYSTLHPLNPSERTDDSQTITGPMHAVLRKRILHEYQLQTPSYG